MRERFLAALLRKAASKSPGAPAFLPRPGETPPNTLGLRPAIGRLPPALSAQVSLAFGVGAVACHRASRVCACAAACLSLRHCSRLRRGAGACHGAIDSLCPAAACPRRFIALAFGVGWRRPRASELLCPCCRTRVARVAFWAAAYRALVRATTCRIFHEIGNSCLCPGKDGGSLPTLLRPQRSTMTGLGSRGRGPEPYQRRLGPRTPHRPRWSRLPRRAGVCRA